MFRKINKWFRLDEKIIKWKYNKIRIIEKIIIIILIRDSKYKKWWKIRS